MRGRNGRMPAATRRRRGGSASGRSSARARAGVPARPSQRAGRLRRQVDRPGRALPPLHRRCEGVDYRLDPRLGILAARRARRGSSRVARPRLPGPRSIRTTRSCDLAEVGLDPLEGVAMGVEEEAAVTGAHQVGELGDRRLGLAVARAPGDVGEEAVGGADTDDLLARLAGDPAQRDQVARPLEGRQGGRRREQRPGAQDVLRSSGPSAASGNRPARGRRGSSCAPAGRGR